MILRLALLLHRSRKDFPIDKCRFTAVENVLEVKFPEGWLAKHPLTLADLSAEEDYLSDIDISLITS